VTDSEYVHYVLVIDRSGSMDVIREDTQGGIRAFIDKQMEGVDGNKRTVSMYQFDTVHDTLHDFALLEQAKGYVLTPRGGTALLDACGFAITKVGEKLAAMPEEKRPGYVMVVIATDGQENSSKEYTRAQVKEMIQRQQDEYGWRFTYIGANQDSFAEAGSIGIAAPSVLNYMSTGASTSSAWASAGASVSAGTTPTSTGIFYSSAQRDAAMGHQP
jgi:uncharacterized protein YegL